MEHIFRAYEEGYSALLLTGRSLYDLTVDKENKVRPILEILRQESRSRYGMAVVTYSLAGGLDWDRTRIDDDRDRRTIQNVLHTHHLTDIPQDQNELIRVIRGFPPCLGLPPTALNGLMAGQ